MQGISFPVNPVPGLTLKWPLHPSSGHSRPTNPSSSVGIETVKDCSPFSRLNLKLIYFSENLFAGIIRDGYYLLKPSKSGFRNIKR